MENADLPLKKDEIYERLKFYARDIERDPQTNSVFRLAQDYFFALSKGELSADALSAPVQDITDELFRERAAFIAMQHELHLPESPWEMINEKLSLKAAEGLDAFKDCVETPVGGIVFTAHPTFANPLSERQRLAELAVSDATEHEAPAQTDDTQGITLQQEHEEAQNAIANAQASVSSYLKAVLQTARTSYPSQWRSLRPVAPTLASWVGYDLDGRSDIHWWTSLAYRLKEKSEQIGRYASMLKDIAQSAKDAAAIEALTAELETAQALAAKQSDLFFGDLSKAELMVQAANTLTENDDKNLVSIRALSERVAALMDGEDDDTALRLLQLSRQMEILGFGTARIHLRINAAQIQSVIRRDLGFLTEDNDLGQVALDTLADKLRATVPAKINFGDLFLEQSTARRQFMLCAQISKHIDADTPIRFLIAESENPATVLGALYLARQYGVEAQLDISPLFETPEALENGGRFVARLLKVPEFQDYARTRGQLSIQLGFSDAGRFIGQVAADIAIERIQSHIASALAEQMPGIALLFFNTHGESAGR
ncbi:MAG TPA: phosphoenolpyruvate carboxylase, partial [Hyphomonadaceae bacterium]|nr:phosphoenolpyruvate carboxylase [Hyphomonadaceae bacterium]